MNLDPLSGFWANAKSLGFTPRRCLEIVLAVLCAWLLHGGVSVWVACGFVVLIYLLGPLEEMARALIANRRVGPQVDRDRREHGGYLEEQRERLESDRPPLPLEAPRSRRGGEE